MKFQTVLALSAAAAGLYAILRKRSEKLGRTDGPVPELPATLEDELESRMKEFVAGDHFSLFIQPVVELSTGKICGGEVLSRLNHPERGLIFPDEFLKVINRMEMQRTFDLYIFRKSCAWLSRTRRFDHISVNFSRKTLSEPEIALQLCDIADQYQVPHENVAIEITEWEKEKNIEQYRSNLKQLREKGFKIFLDDYGSGVTSIADLNQCSIDIVKIDRSVLLAAERADGSIILQSLTEMASRLGVDVVCEGIETEAQEKLARDCGCRYGQGFRYFKPVSAVELPDMIEKSSITGDDAWSD